MRTLPMLAIAIMVVAVVPWWGVTQAQPRTFRDCAQCPEMVELPAGAFTMGAAPGEEERENVPPPFRGRSGPQQRMTIGPSFALGKFEVTRGEYAAFVAATNRASAEGCYVFEAGRWRKQPERNWRNPGFEQTDRDPVVCVSWDDADAYVKWLAASTGKNYLLPSDVEGEYAARGGATTAWFWGDGKDEACSYGNFADRKTAAKLNWANDPETTFACADDFSYTAPVGSFKPNGFGLYDMLGNVWEWTGDCWADDLSEVARNRTAAASPYASACPDRVYRGGAWYGAPWDTRAAVRVRAIAKFASIYLGFRVARAP